MHHLAGQKFLDILVALLFLEWTLGVRDLIDFHDLSMAVCASSNNRDRKFSID